MKDQRVGRRNSGDRERERESECVCVRVVNKRTN
jgi:hypothetical protein